MRISPQKLCVCLGFALALGACGGSKHVPDTPADSGIPPDAGMPQADAGPEPGPAPVRRLTNTEYDNVVRDLLGDDTAPAEAFEPDQFAFGFNDIAEALTVSEPLAEQYLAAAEDCAARADLSKLLPCNPTEVGEATCGAQFVERFGFRAFRRPLTEDEKARWIGLFQSDLAEEGFAPAIRLVITGILQSPSFLYRIEGGAPGSEGEVVPLTQWELASRLSFLFWQSMPDQELFEAAAAGQLSTPEELVAQADRLLASPRSRDTVRDFHEMWLLISSDSPPMKDPVQFPDFPDVWPLLREETDRFVEDVFWSGAPSSALFTARYSFMNGRLATFYERVSKDIPPSDDFVQVDLAHYTRQGLLTHASILSTAARFAESSPTFRGKFVREQLLCQDIPAPPPGVVTDVSGNDGTTNREKTRAHAQNPSCSGCHSAMDNIGFGLENYDAVGRYRYKDGSEVVDANGTLTLSDGPHDFDGPISLSNLLAQSEDVNHCMVRQWFRFAFGRHEEAGDGAALARVNAAFDDSGHDMRQILRAFVQSDTFRLRRRTSSGVAP